MDSKLHFEDPITAVSGVGEATAEKLERLNIGDVADIIKHYPSRYLDFTTPTVIKELKEKVSSSFTAKITGLKTFFTGSGKLMTQATAQDETGKIKLTWFNNPYIKRLIKEGGEYSIAGKPSFFAGKLTIVSPVIEEKGGFSLNTKGLVPVYPLTAGLTSKWFRSKIYKLLDQTEIIEPLTEDILNGLSLIGIENAYRQIHFPKDTKEHWQADKRLSFNEHLRINLRNQLEMDKLGDSYVLDLNKDLDIRTKERLPFKLTEDQEKTIQSIYKDLSDKSFSHRLIQGDTGSGKTVTLIFASNQCLNNQTSFILMAPTEILARQHFETFKKYSMFPTNIQFVSGSTNESIIDHKPMIFIGTHALINQIPAKLKFPVSLIAIDEQHKFGVKQREELIKRSPLPHLINLSATPIPRTVALGLIGDLEISNITHKPQNRLPIKTHVVPATRYKNSTKWLKEKILAGNSIFVVCPNISDHGQGVSSVDLVFKEYQKKFSDICPIWTLHGKMNPEEQQKTITSFKNAKSAILVATSLIEVGIDIPSANIMVIHSAERFGLAQLHQLRGRVGRGDAQAYCFLIPSTDEETETERLQLLQKYDSGLVLAQKDLRLRGSGELFGLKQHGVLATRLKYFWSKKLFTEAKKLSKDIIHSDKPASGTILDKLDQT